MISRPFLIVLCFENKVQEARQPGCHGLLVGGGIANFTDIAATFKGHHPGGGSRLACRGCAPMNVQKHGAA